MHIAVWADATFCPAEESESFRQEVGLSDDYKILSVPDDCTEDEMWAIAETWASLRACGSFAASLRQPRRVSVKE